MSHRYKSSLESTVNVVDWGDPRLQSLLDKTEGWGLDNRGVFAPVACELFVGWGAAEGKPATLVFQRSGAMVVEANFIIPKGEHVRLERVLLGNLRATWGTVVDGREGNRAEDRANGTHIYWIHVR